MGCKYSPYTIAECKAEINRVTELIKDNSGTSNFERIRNGNDEYQSGDVISTLLKELEFWERMLKLACDEAQGNPKRRFIGSAQYGC